MVILQLVLRSVEVGAFQWKIKQIYPISLSFWHKIFCSLYLPSSECHKRSLALALYLEYGHASDLVFVLDCKTLVSERKGRSVDPLTRASHARGHIWSVSPQSHSPICTLYSKGRAVSLQNPRTQKYCVAVHNRTLDHQGEEKAFQNNVALILKPLDELLTCDHSIKTYWTAYCKWEKLHMQRFPVTVKNSVTEWDIAKLKIGFHPCGIPPPPPPSPSFVEYSFFRVVT